MISSRRICRKETKDLKRQTSLCGDRNENKGGLPSPVVVQLTLSDGSQQVVLPSRKFNKIGSRLKLLTTKKEITVVQIDLYREMAERQSRQQRFPPLAKEEWFDLQLKKDPPKSPMKEALDRQKKKNLPEEMESSLICMFMDTLYVPQPSISLDSGLSTRLNKKSSLIPSDGLTQSG